MHLWHQINFQLLVYKIQFLFWHSEHQFDWYLIILHLQVVKLLEVLAEYAMFCSHAKNLQEIFMLNSKLNLLSPNAWKNVFKLQLLRFAMTKLFSLRAHQVKSHLSSCSKNETSLTYIGFLWPYHTGNFVTSCSNIIPKKNTL